MQDTYDVIIIGSGIGALTAARILSGIGNKRVLIIEKHFLIGGLTNEFHRKQFSWEVGMQYVGGMNEGSFGRAVMDFVTDKQVSWNPLPHLFEHIRYPNISIDVPSDPDEFKDVLVRTFPLEQDAIAAYFKDIQTATDWYYYQFAQKNGLECKDTPGLFSKQGDKTIANMTTQEYLDGHFKDPLLKTLLTSQWGNYGLPPDQSSFATHAFITSSYCNGGFFPEGGSQTISKAVVKLLHNNDSETLIGHEATQILIRDGQAYGVKTKSSLGQEEVYFADHIISNTGAEVTFSQLVPEEFGQHQREAIRQFPHGTSAVILYLGLQQDPRSLGVDAGNYWIFEDTDHNQVNTTTQELLKGNVTSAMVSFQSIKQTNPTSHTAEIMINVDPSYFEQWSHRPDEYYETKDIITNGMLTFLEKHFPGIGSLIEFKELGTPLTILHFINRPRGEMYGIPGTPKRFALDVLQANTSINNLYLSGSDVCSLGIYGAMLGGVAAAANVMGTEGFEQIVHSIY